MRKFLLHFEEVKNPIQLKFNEREVEANTEEFTEFILSLCLLSLILFESFSILSSFIENFRPNCLRKLFAGERREPYFGVLILIE